VTGGGLGVTNGMTVHNNGLKISGGVTLNDVGLYVSVKGVTVANDGIKVTAGASVLSGGLKVVGGLTLTGTSGLYVTDGGATVALDGMKVAGGLTVYGDITYTGSLGPARRRLAVDGEEDEEENVGLLGDDQLRSDVEELKAKLEALSKPPTTTTGDEDQSEVAELRMVLAEYQQIKDQQEKVIRDLQEKFAELMAQLKQDADD